MERTINYIKARRAEIADIEATLNQTPHDASPFLESAKLWLALGRGWLGKALGALGEAHPYPQSYNPESPAIESPAYQLPAQPIEFGIDAVAGTKSLRARIKDCLSKGEPPSGENVDFHFQLNQYSVAMQNANMCLGEYLGSLRT